MEPRILERLGELEAEHGFQIFYACESGSRAWGFASDDSDYDVRFVFAWPKDHYLSIRDPKDDLSLGVDPENLDFAGWELRKALRLFQRSNGALLEWLHSPIVYRQKAEILDNWRGLIPDVYDPRASALHYLGMFKNTWLGGIEQGNVTAKGYLYSLRALLGAGFVLDERKPIPVAFSELLARTEETMPHNVRAAIGTMIAAKTKSAEKAPIDRVPVIDTYIEEQFAIRDATLLALESGPPSSEPLDNFFRQVLARSD